MIPEASPNTIRLFTVDEAADVLKLPKSWIYERTRRKAIPFHRIGKYVRFTTEDLAAIISAQPAPNTAGQR